MDNKLKIIVAPDSFKGTMSSYDAGKIISDAVLAVFEDCEVIQLVIADGGEGSLEAFYSNLGGDFIYKSVSSANFTPVTARYLMPSPTSAIIEMAECAGLTITANKNPELTTTLGVGELILDAILRGATSITLTLGGSSTNDCGAGMAVGLGAKFFDGANNCFVPNGATLKDVVACDLTALKKNIEGVSFTVMCDVKNPLYGENGSAHIYARQKGADDEMILRLDESLRCFAKTVFASQADDIVNTEGAGSAGGLGAGAIFFLGGRLVSGIEAVLDLCDFDNLLKGASLVVSGEGRFDTQSLMGKVVGGIAKRTKNTVPLVVFAGEVQAHSQNILKEYNITALPTAIPLRPFNEILKTCRSDLYNTAYKFFSEWIIKP